MFRRFLSSLRDIAGSCVERVGIIFIYQPVANMWLQFFEALRCVREELCWSDWKSFQRKIWLQHIHHQQSWLEAAEKGPSLPSPSIWTILGPTGPPVCVRHKTSISVVYHPPKTCPGVQARETKYVQFQLMFIFILPLRIGPPWVWSKKLAKLR